MSAVLAHFARDENLPIKLHLMAVPAIDMRYCFEKHLDESNCPYESARLFQFAPWSPMSRETWYLDNWLPTDAKERQEALDSWIMTPMIAPDLRNLGRAHVVTAEFDLARDEAELYAQRLGEAGNNEVTVKRYAGMPHAFGYYVSRERGLEKAREYWNDCVEVIGRAHYEP